MNPGVVSALGVLVGGVSFGLAGFAFALFATASLALSSPPQVVVPAVMLLADTLALPLLWEHRRSLRRDRLQAVPPFAPWSFPLLLIGIGAGTLLLGRVTPAVGRSALAAVVLAFVAFQCVRPGRGAPPEETGGAGVAAGAALGAGILDGWRAGFARSAASARVPVATGRGRVKTAIEDRLRRESLAIMGAWA